MPKLSAVSDRVLLLSPEAPYPLAGGGAMRSSSILQLLTRNHSVHLITFREPEAPHPRESLPKGLVKDLSVVNLSHHSRGFWMRSWRNAIRLLRGVLPLTDRFGNKSIRNKVLNELQGKRYRAAIVEHFWCAPYFEILRNYSDRVVLNLPVSYTHLTLPTILLV